jgi:hypothetical protein
MFDQIEKLKQDYTDQYVVVDASIPELARFEGHVGQVKTVNMNGRALVQFDAWSNIGWYDIEVDFLKVVPKPDATTKPAAKHEAPAKAPPKAAPAATGEKKLSPLEMARMQGAAIKPGDKPAPAAGGAKKSTADILAAARAGKATQASGGAPAADKSAAPAAKPKMSTADVLAAARAKKAAEASREPADQPASAVASPSAPAAEPEAVEATAEVPQAPAKKSAAPLPKGQRPTVSEILAWCRANDAK